MGLTLVGLGIKSGDVSVSALDAIKSADVVFLRTEKTHSASFLKEIAVGYETFDGLYESSRSFSSLTKKIVSRVRAATKGGKKVVYTVDGAVSEDISCAALVRSIKSVEIFEGVSKAADALSRCGLSGVRYTAVSAYEKELGSFSCPLVVFDIDDRYTASEWKLKLFDRFGEETPVSLMIGGELKRIPLYAVDTFDNYDYSTVLVVDKVALTEKERFTVDDLFAILYVLRGENGCPWDRVQTKESIRENLIEEAYELVEAIDLNDDDKMREEIGDVLMQAAFHTLFAEERGAFSRRDVISDLCTKLITRHTHVFGSDSAISGEAALSIWNKNKQKEKGYDSVYEYVSAVPKVFPALMRAQKVFKRAASHGYVVSDLSLEHIRLLAEECEKEGVSSATAGELLFLAAAIIKKRGISAEEALADYVKAFESDLNAVEKSLKERGKTMNDVAPTELEKVYNEVKKS